MNYFTIKELCRSDVAIENGVSNSPSNEAKLNLRKLIKTILNPIRVAYGKPIYVNSGYRCKRLNYLVGGVSNSNHLYGRAADITLGSKEENKKLFILIKSLNLPIDELINEEDYTWIHISFKQ